MQYQVDDREIVVFMFFFFSSRRRHTRLQGDWSSDVCSSDLLRAMEMVPADRGARGGGRFCDSVVVVAGRRAADRKSTRLNSSHLVISYAVFCLKKKKQHDTIVCMISVTKGITGPAFSLLVDP